MAARRVIKVFIASPGDLAVERRAFKDTVDSLNKGFGRGADVTFEPLGWEDALSTVGRRAQSVINRDVDACDVFILVMWRRWGQEAPDAAPYSSYTEEEFHRALARYEKINSPTIFVYFKDLDADSVADPGRQLRQVLDFRAKLSKRALYRTFRDVDAFVNVVAQDLINYVKQGVLHAALTSTVDLVMQAVITPGLQVEDGVLIEAVTIPWHDIVEMLQKNPKAAFEISPRKWEEIIAGAYKKAGFDDVILTPSSGDFGRDVIAEKRGIGKIRIIDQVKAYKPGHLVTANDVRALLGVLQGDRASKGFLTTTSDFAPRLRDDILLKPFFPSTLELVNGDALLRRLRELAATAT